MAWKPKVLNAIHQQVDREALRSLGLATVDDIWQEIGKNRDGLDPLVVAGADRSRLVRDLMDCAKRDAGEKGLSWLRRHLLDFVLVAAALALAALVAWALTRARSVGIALRDLRSGEPVSADSLYGADPDRIANRRLLQDVPRSGFVKPDWLAPVAPLGDRELQGRYRLPLHICAEDLRLLPTLPARVSLAVSAAGPGPPGALLLRDIPALAAERSGTAGTLDAALTGAELQSLLPLLSRAEIHVVRSLR